MKRDEEIKILLTYLVKDVERTASDINCCIPTSYRMSDYLKRMDTICTNMVELRAEYTYETNKPQEF